MRSLTLKLIISFVSVAALSIAVLAVVINRAASIEFTSYLELIGRMQGMMEGMMGGMMGYGRNMMGMMGALGEPEQKFLGNLRSSLVWTGIATIGLALVTAILLARQIVLPLRRLTAATRELAAGNLKQRVEVTSHDEIGEVGRAFNSMADKLARNEELRRNMIADIAHELRTPLTVLQGDLEAMQDGIVEASPARLGVLHDEVLRLSRLVSDLRTLSLAEAGQLELNLESVDAGPVVSRVAASRQTAAAAKKISLATEIPANLPQVRADPDRLEQVLHNLLDNALRYTPEGGRITVTATPGAAPPRARGGEVSWPVRSRQVSPQISSGEVSSPGAGWVTFQVADTGPGIAEKDMPHIFERFYRADPSRSHATGGSGIGLAIVKQLVESQGGEAWATSQAGRGSTFSFTLPTG